MPRLTILAAASAGVALAVAALSGCSVMDAPAADPTPTSTSTVGPTPTPTPTYPTELPEWAKEGDPLWLVYPDGFECGGTEGCPNDFRAFIGEPGPVLPEGVEYYDPARHNCVIVQPVGVDCLNRPAE